MSFELYNSTEKTLELPKFNYNGKIKLSSHQSVSIEEHMTKFYKPWASLGVSIREVNADEPVAVEVEPEVKTVIEEGIKEEVVVEDTAEIVEDKIESIDAVETEVENEKTMTVTYTQESLQFCKLKELKEIASNLGVEVPDDINRKATVIEMILDAQNK